VVVVMAIRPGRSTSQLLMPLVFSAHAGSLMALTGTPVNVLVSEAAVDAGVAAFGYFEFAIVGIPLLLGTMAIVVLLGRVTPTLRQAGGGDQHPRGHRPPMPDTTWTACPSA
jgi:di/tricarboxylate transporter